MVGLICFYSGLLVGSQHHNHDETCWTANDPRIEALINNRVNSEVEKMTKQFFEKQLRERAADAQDALRFPQQDLGKVVAGMARVNRDDFIKQFDMGVPFDPTVPGNRQALVLYSKISALPESNAFLKEQSMREGEIPVMESVQQATENCHQLHVILSDFQRDHQCIAILGQYESFHIQKFMRLPQEGRGPVDAKLPLRLVNRGAQTSGRKSTAPPTKEQTLKYWTVLSKYLASLPDMLSRLKPTVEKVADDHNTVIVMVCNLGQSELLMNFVCNAKAKKLDISNVLVVCTDTETQEIATHLGLETFYDATTFGDMPKQAARQYGDSKFAGMMAAKVYCVQLVTMLGYNVLFQDVDVIWYKNPLPWFYNPELAGDFDIYFQDDGNHAVFYAPYSANTGFYYVRHNDRTQYFFNSLLLAGDLIVSTKSHQIALIALLNEHASLYGLKVKIFERNTRDFPGGYSYHRKPDFMKDVIQGRIEPYIFHMSWTLNKDNKQLFFRQLGEWYVQETCTCPSNRCIGKELSDIFGEGDVKAGILEATCCSADPIISCHYRDKPSKIPCRDSPPIDEGRPSFW